MCTTLVSILLTASFVSQTMPEATHDDAEVVTEPLRGHSPQGPSNKMGANGGLADVYDPCFNSPRRIRRCLAVS